VVRPRVAQVGDLPPAEGRIARSDGCLPGICEAQRTGLAGRDATGRARPSAVYPARSTEQRRASIGNPAATTAPPIRGAAGHWFRTAGCPVYRRRSVFRAACPAHSTACQRPSPSCGADGWYADISCAEVPVAPSPRSGESQAGRQQPPPQGGHTACQGISARPASTVRPPPQDGAVAVWLLPHDLSRRCAVATLLKVYHLAKSSADGRWSALLSLLAVEVACAGREVGAVDPVLTGQLCSGCGALVQKGLTVRWHRCPGCDLYLYLHLALTARRRFNGAGSGFGDSRRWLRE
jgi:hypothetical protein